MKSLFKSFILFSMLTLVSLQSFAEIPEETVVFGNKAFSMDFILDENNEEIIAEAVMSLSENEKIFIKTSNGTWYNMEEEVVAKEVIPEIKYIKGKGEFSVYEKMDGNLIVNDKIEILDISVTDKKTLEIVFSQEVKEVDFADYIKLSDNLMIDTLELNENKDRLIINLKEAIEENKMEGNIVVSKGISNTYDVSIPEDFNMDFIVLNTKEVSDEVFNKNVSIIVDNFKGENLKFKQRVSLTGDNASLSNSEAKILNINPGKDGDCELRSVKADMMQVFSGADHSIIVKDSEVGELTVQSENNTRIKAEGQSKVSKISVKSDAILETKSKAFGEITVKGTNKEKKLTLDGEFSKIEAGNNSFIVATGESKVGQVVVQGTTKVEGNFGSIEVGEEASGVEFAGETKVEKLKVGKDVDIKVTGKVEIEEYDGDTEEVEKIKDKVTNEDKKDEDKKDEDDSVPPVVKPVFKTTEYVVKGVKLTINIYTEYNIFNGRFLHDAEIEIDLGNLKLSDSEKIAFGVRVFDENQNLIDWLNLTEQDNKLKYKNLKLVDGKGSIRLVTEEKGDIVFDIE